MRNNLIGLALVASLFLSSCGWIKNTKKHSRSDKIERVSSSSVSAVNVSTSQESVKQTELDKSTSRVTIEEMETAKLASRRSGIEIDANAIKLGAITLLDSFGNVFVVKLDTVANKLGIGLQTPPIDLLKQKKTTYDGQNNVLRIIDGLKNQKDSGLLDLKAQEEIKEEKKETDKLSTFDFWGLIIQVLPLLLVAVVLFFIFKKFIK